MLQHDEPKINFSDGERNRRASVEIDQCCASAHENQNSVLSGSTDNP